MKVATRKFKVEVPSVAMGDIAFNLLVFFVILARAQDDVEVFGVPAEPLHGSGTSCGGCACGFYLPRLFSLTETIAPAPVRNAPQR